MQIKFFLKINAWETNSMMIDIVLTTQEVVEGIIICDFLEASIQPGL